MFNPGRADGCSRFLTFVRNDKEGVWKGKESVWNDKTMDARHGCHALAPI